MVKLVNIIGISIAGALIRIYFVQRPFGRNKPLYLAVAAVILLAVSFVMAPKTSNSVASAGETKEQLTAQAMSIVKQRCVTCHSTSPTQAGFSAAPKGMIYDTEQQIVSQAMMIHQQAVVSKAMPLANLTQITDEERAILDRWFKSLK